MRKSHVRIGFLFGVLALLASGCAQQVGDIDRTQPNRIEKAAFEGEWYFRQTVVGVNGTAITTFVGLEGQMERVVFSVEENYLVAYEIEEDVIGIDSTALPVGETMEHGQPVVAYPIESHFDVQRQYNSSTGEQTNVIVENTSDRNWYEREFMRVDWSQNHVITLVDPMVEIYDIADVSIAPQDQTEEPTWFVERNEDDEVVYIDVLSQFIIEPDFVECYLTFGYPLWGSWCAPETITVRSSFAKITEESDFVPREYDDHEMVDFGFMRTRRATYDRNYGPRDSNRVSVANIWNIWAQSLRPDGSVIPYAEREPGQIVYYLSANTPEELRHIAFEVADQYDNAFRRTVAAHKGIAIPSDPRDMDQVPYDLVPRMFYLCENPGGTDGAFELSNEGYRLGYCQRPNQIKNHGDVRFSFFNWVGNPQQVGPAGYGPSSPDPLTGEVISANANVYGWYIDYYAQYTLDVAKMITGEIDTVEYGHGRVMEDYFERLRAENDNDLYFGLLERGTEEIAHLRDAAARLLARPRVQHLLSRDVEDFRLRNNAEVSPLELLRGTELERIALFPEVERHLMPPHYQQQIVSGQLDTSGGLDDDQVHALSLATVGDPVRMARDARRQNLRFSMHGANQACIYMADINDPAVLGMARELAEERETLRSQGLTEDAIDQIQWQAIREGQYRDLLAHEAGHTVGLRHNFEASYDSLNYGIEYWRLRERTFDTCDESAITFPNDGFYSGRLAPPPCGDEANQETVEQYNARNAALLEELLEARIHDFEASSTMDYLYKPSHNWQGLGLYDYAALAYGYGELHEVFAEAPQMLYVEVNYDPATDSVSSTEVRQSEHRVSTFDDVDEYFIRRRNQIEGDDPAYLRDDEIGHEHSYSYYHYSTLPIMFGGDIEAMHERRLVPASEVGQQVVVPYRFCGDEYTFTSVECQWFDQGADFLESFQNVRDTWDQYYVLNHFRRGRPGFGLWLYPILSRFYSRTMAPMTRLYQYWLIRAASRGTAWYNASWGGEDSTLAMLAAIDFLGNQVNRPSIGTYYYDEDLEMYLNLDDELDYQAPFHFEIDENIDPATDYLNVGMEVGRYGFEQFRRDENDEAGYYYFLESEILSWFWAKWAAMMALVLPEVDVIGVDAASDVTAYSIPIYLIFEEEMASFFGAIPREDFDVLGSCVQMNGTGREADVIRQRNLASGAPADCSGAARLNPYTEVYGNSDFNMRMLAILYGAAYFQSNYSPSWFDLSNVYVLGRGYNLDPGEGHSLAVYEHDNGIQYAALAPLELGPDDNEEMWVGMQLVYRAQELRDLRDVELEANGESDVYWDHFYELENLIEDMRLLNQANALFEGWNVYLPLTL